MTQKIFLEILDDKRRKIFQALGFSKSYKLYLAGGTALALQIGHRTSYDFDFYTPEKFQSGQLTSVFKEHFPHHHMKVVRDKDNTFEMHLDEVLVSCFYYPYALLKPTIKIDHLAITSLEDIAAMKVVAIAQRGTQRDFIDMYFLLKHFSLSQILDFTRQKFPEFDIYNGLRGLVYFDDADKEGNMSRICVLDKSFSWQATKKFIEEKVFEFQKKY